METLETVVNRLTAPPLFYTLTLLACLLGTRSRFLWQRTGAILLVVVGAGVLGAGLNDPGIRRLLLAPERLPVTVFLLSSLVVLWLAMHGTIRGQRPRVTAGAERQDLETMTIGGALWLAIHETVRGRRPGVTAGAERHLETMTVGAVAVVIFALAGMTEVPLAGPAPGAGGSPPDPAKTLWYLTGFQELSFYFPPWVAAYLLPALLLAALLALPALDPGAELEASGEASPASETVARPAIYLFAALALVLLPMAIAVYLRGPQWNAFGPFEAWDSLRPPPAPAEPLSEVIWCRALGLAAPPASVITRELPGLLLLAGYFAALPIYLPRWKAARGIFGRYQRAAGRWRYRLALALALVLLTIPLKMYGRWLLGIGSWLHLPELGFSF